MTWEKLNSVRHDDGRVGIEGPAPDEIAVSVEMVADALPQYLRTTLTFSDDFGRVTVYEVAGSRLEHNALVCRLVSDGAAEPGTPVVRVTDTQPGDVLVVCPPPGDVWSVEQADGLRRHLDARFVGKGVDFAILRANAQFAALRRAYGGLLTINQWRERHGLPPVPWGDHPWMPMSKGEQSGDDDGDDGAAGVPAVTP